MYETIAARAHGVIRNGRTGQFASVLKNIREGGGDVAAVHLPAEVAAFKPVTKLASDISLVDMLCEAFASEWLAYYQYWLGAKVVTGPTADKVREELMAHAREELDHAGMLADRIVKLGGDPVIDPALWCEWSPCEFDAPTNGFVAAILQQNLAGEECAIDAYRKILDSCGADRETFAIVKKIHDKEVEHARDLEKLQAGVAL